MAIPGFDQLSSLYPDYWNYPKPEAVKALIGGETKDPDITNTCAIRMCHALNRCGYTVPPVWEGISNRRGANRWHYIIRVVNLRTWLRFRCGKPNLDFRKKAAQPFDRSQIAGSTGIIAFEIGFGDATGHFDLWYGDKFSHESSAGMDYFKLATRISLWTGDMRVSIAPA